MWVIYDYGTGEEYDRIESHSEARAKLAELNKYADYDHYTMRWED